MRPIKFRAWNDASREMIYDWHYDHCRVSLAAFFGEILPLEKRDGLMQFTGLYDKNGKEIYEGDIIVMVSENGKDGRKYHVVNFSDGAFFSGDRRIYQTMANFMRILGNLYENPELIQD